LKTDGSAVKANFRESAFTLQQQVFVAAEIAKAVPE